MEILAEFVERFISLLRSPTLAFLFAGMVAAAVKSELRLPDSIYKFCVFMLLMRIGLSAGMAIRGADIMGMLVPAIFSIILGFSIVMLGSVTLARLPGVKRDDALATAGLFGAVSGATLVAGTVTLREIGVYYEAWVPALYPFMDIPALVTAIVLANMYLIRKARVADVKVAAGAEVAYASNPGHGNSNPAAHGDRIAIWPIIRSCLTGMALTTLVLGVILGLITRPERVFNEFFDPLFRGFLSVLMLILGMEAYGRLKELKKVGHWYVGYAFVGPIVHGLMGFGLGWIAYQLVGLSPGGVIMLAVIAASNSDISGPPTLRAGIPSANPSAYIGTSTGLGTAVAIAICIPLFIALGRAVFGF